MPLAYGLIHPVDIALAALPPSLQGLRIAHLSDLHVRRHTRRLDRLITQLTSLRLDMVLLTGDYMTRHHEAVEAAAVLKRITDALRPTYGFFGVFGNHDSQELVSLVQNIGIAWLGSGVQCVSGLSPGVSIQLAGIDPLDPQGEDSVATLLNPHEQPEAPDANNCLRLMLAHYPSWYTTAADMGVHVLFSGHTHGGQIRLPNGQAFVNACDLPLDLSCGILRHRDTLVAISRGLGEVGVPFNRFRLFCPPHVPVYTLRRGPTLGPNTPGLVKVVRW